MADIFLSYSRTDRPRVAPLVAALEAKGWSVWWDTELAPGVDFDAVTADALKSVGAVLVVWTPTSVTSRWVRGEARVGADRGVLVPVRFENAELPIDVRTIHTTDLDDWSGDPESPTFQKLAQSLAGLLGGASPVAPTPIAPERKLPGKPSIAVMPFANLSGDPEQDYFADGMVEEIVAALTRFKSLFVIASGSTLSFKGKVVSPQEVARQLGVRYVLEGSVRKAGGRVRIAVKLTEAANGTQMWSDRFEDTFEDVFALQDKVALSVAVAIEPTVQQAEIRRAASRPTENMDSYDLYLRAYPLLFTFVASESRKALELLDRAIALDPDFGRAIAFAAWCHSLFERFGWSDDPEYHRRRSIELARHAVTVGGDDAEALAVAANVIASREPHAARALINRAIALNPGAATVWNSSGGLYVAAGEPELAVEDYEAALRLDPVSPRRAGRRMFLGVARFQQGRFSEALALLSEVVHQVKSPVAPAYLAATYGQLGRRNEAGEALEFYRERSPAPVEERAIGSPEHRAVFLQGIAVAKGETPAQTST